jgi:endonuclease YncB( thermonuclease family)
VLLVACAGAPPPAAPAPEAAAPPKTVTLDGQRFDVRWSDGDTFNVTSGALKGARARLSGFNTLEDFGPVHRWGDWTHQELFELALAPEKVLNGRGWACTSTGQRDQYERLLVKCPEVAQALIGEGLAMVLAIDEAPEPRLVDAQKAAQAAGKGIWRKGVPPLVVTSLHSIDEGKGYNRLVDTRTGVSTPREHQEKYETCQEVCEGPPEKRSCMVYVPHERRYRNKPDCLKGL